MLGRSSSHSIPADGKLGGKSAGLFLAKKIIEKIPEASAQARQVKTPRTWYITSDWILDFVHHNELEDVLNWKYMEIDQVREEYPHPGRSSRVHRSPRSWPRDFRWPWMSWVSVL